MDELPFLSPSSSNLSGSAHTNVTNRKRILPPSSPGLRPQPKQAKAVDQQQQQQQMQSVPLAAMIAKPQEKTAPAPKIAVKTNMVRSVHISPFVPSTDPSHIMGHLELIDDLKHIVQKIVCTELAKKNRRFTIVSFKLDVPRHHFDIFVNPETWKMNGNDEITIKEFVVKRDTQGHGSTKDKDNPFKLPPISQKQNQKNHSAKNKPKNHPKNQRQQKTQSNLLSVQILDKSDRNNAATSLVASAIAVPNTTKEIGTAIARKFVVKCTIYDKQFKHDSDLNLLPHTKKMIC